MYIDFLILLISTPLVSALFCSSFPTFCSPATTGVPRQPYEGHTRRSTHKRTLHILRWTSALCLQGAGCRFRSRGCALYRDASRAAYVL